MEDMEEWTPASAKKTSLEETLFEQNTYPLVNVNKKLWKITMLFMGKLTKYISMAIFQFAFCMFTRGYLKM
jgi:hypothetical protein